jgi:hypothetical protein
MVDKAAYGRSSAFEQFDDTDPESSVHPLLSKWYAVLLRAIDIDLAAKNDSREA